MTDLTYKEAHAKWDKAIEPMSTMDLIQMAAMIEESDPSYYKAIQYEIKLRAEKRGKYAESGAR